MKGTQHTAESRALPRWFSPGGLHTLKAHSKSTDLTFQFDPYLGTFACPDGILRRAAVGDDLQKSHATQHGEYLSGRAFRIGGLHLADFGFAYENLERGRLRRE